MSTKFTIRTALMITSAMAATAMLPAQAFAAEDEEGATTGIRDIVVTAQKREQSVQDVPIAVTAFDSEAIEDNRITTVQDLTGLAPGMIVRPSAGGIATPSFTMRGQNSFGVVAGSDKQISIYLDGVYISSPRGSIFDLPDVARIEVLRGPQGTLFGRNATGGAVSITTRDPTGEAFVKVAGTVGNRGQYRIGATIETPGFGPFTGYFSFVRDYKRGDIKNANPGLLWDRTAIGDQFAPSQGIFPKTQKSVKYLGTRDTYSYFGALKFEPHPDFKIVYKYDRNRDTGSPEGTAFVGHDPNYFGIVGPVIEALTTSQPTFQAPNAKRPNMVANGWVTPRDMLIQGHSVTATWDATDNLTVRNVFSHRKVFVSATSAIDGVSSLIFTEEAVDPMALLFAGGNPAVVPFVLPLVQSFVGSRFGIIASQATSTSKQYSNEFQVNWDAGGRLKVTAGALWFHSKDGSGYAGNTITFPTFLPTSGVVPLTKVGFNINTATSLAAYAQLEFAVTDQLELVLGGRITRDKKGETFTYGPPGGLQTINPPTYKKTKPNFLIGVNYNPNDDILVYGKFSTSFVSGGASIGVPYAPETATSWEAGVKADLLDRKLRVNLAMFHVKYKHFQSPQGTSQASSRDLIVALTTPLFGPVIANELPGFVSTFVVDQGSIRAQGFELEVTVAPTDGLTFGGGLGFTDTKYTYINPLVLDSNNGQLAVTQRPKWTGTAWAQYDTQPLWGDAYASFRINTTYFGKMTTDTQALTRTEPELLVVRERKAFALLNGRIALKGINVGGAEAEFAIWGRNLTDNRSSNFVLVQPIIASANFIPARTYGLDVTVTFR